MDRTNSRKERVRKVMQKQYERQFGNRHLTVTSQMPEIFEAANAKGLIDYK
jgi:hypothetical protein